MQDGEYRFFVHDFKAGIARAHIDLGEVAYDEHGYFWMANERDEGSRYPKERLAAAEIPPDLVFYEFHDLDSESLDDLLGFQQRYGLLTSVFRSHHIALLQDGVTPGALDPAVYFADDLQSIRATNELFVRYDPALGRHAPSEEDGRHSRFSESSLREVRMCVKRLQWATDLLLDARPESGGEDRDSAFIAGVTEALVLAIAEYFPLVEYTQDCSAGRPMPLSALLVAQLMSGLCDTEAFHVCACEECGRRFQWKRNPAGVAGRRTGSKYCSDECQIRQKRINQQRRRHAAASGAGGGDVPSSGGESGVGRSQEEPTAGK